MQQLEITIPLDQWYRVMQNPELWVESIEAIRRLGGTAEFDTRVVEKR